MASVGVNGAAAASLNERFIKCAGCKVNIPKEDMLALGKCTVCGRAYTPEAKDENTVVVHTVAFAGDGAAASSAPATTAPGGAEKPKRKRWVELKSKRGRTYYHNTDTGEDTWEKPVDIDAEAVGNDGFVPFKNDAVKNAVLREQAKIDATKMGLPAEVIASMQQQQLREQQEADEKDPLNSMLKRPAPNAKAPPAPTQTQTTAPYQSRLEGIEDADHEHDDDDEDEEDDVTEHHQSMAEASPAKQGACIVM